MVTTNIRMTTKGPIFDRPTAEIRRGVQGIVQAVVEEGEQELDRVLKKRPVGVYLSIAEAGKGKASIGTYASNVHGRVKNLHGRIDDGGSLYGPWLEGVGRRNLTTRFKGYASFRKTSQYLQKNFRRIAGPAIQRLVERLG